MTSFYKKCWYCVIIFSFVAHYSYSQKVAVGIKAGVGLSGTEITYTTPNPYTPNQSSKFGPVIGGYVDYPLSKKTFLRGGAEIVAKGTTAHQGGGVRLTYLDIPLNFLYKSINKTGSLMLGGGPVIGISLNRNYNGMFSSTKTDVGINAMGGFEFPIGFSVNLNYNYGLRNVSNERQYVSKIMNRYVAATLGYTF